MSRHTLSFVLLCTVLLFCVLITAADNSASQEKHEDFYKFVRTVQDILAGKNADESLAIVSRSARIIHGTRFENLRGVLTGEVKGITLADTSYHGVMIQAQTDPAENAGYLVLKTAQYDTTKVRFHTIFFVKDSTGRFTISVWHAGE